MKCLNKLNKLNKNIEQVQINKIIFRLIGQVNAFLIIYNQLSMNKGKEVRDRSGMDLFE